MNCDWCVNKEKNKCVKGNPKHKWIINKDHVYSKCPEYKPDYKEMVEIFKSDTDAPLAQW